MQILLYNWAGDPRVINKQLTAEPNLTLTGTLREECRIEAPSILIQADPRGQNSGSVGGKRDLFCGFPPGGSKRTGQERTARGTARTPMGRGKYLRLCCHHLRPGKRAACRCRCGTARGQQHRCSHRRGHSFRHRHCRYGDVSAGAGGAEGTGADFRLLGFGSHDPGGAG